MSYFLRMINQIAKVFVSNNDRHFNDNDYNTYNFSDYDYYEYDDFSAYDDKYQHLFYGLNV